MARNNKSMRSTKICIKQNKRKPSSGNVVRYSEYIKIHQALMAGERREEGLIISTLELDLTAYIFCFKKQVQIKLHLSLFLYFRTQCKQDKTHQDRNRFCVHSCYVTKCYTTLSILQFSVSILKFK